MEGWGPVEGWCSVEGLVRWGFAHAPVVIDQTLTVDFGEEGQQWAPELLASLSDILAAHGGTAGILRDQAPPPLAGWAGVDALVVSTDNEMTA